MRVALGSLRVIFSLFLALIVFSSPAVVYGQGFVSMTGSKMTVTLRRKLPAVFILTAPDVKVSITSALPNAAILATQLSPNVETMLQQSDRRITTGNDHAQTLIECTIIGYIPPKVQQITSGTPIQSKKGTIPAKTYQKVTGALTVAYRAKNAQTGKPLDASVLESKIDQDYENGGEKTKSILEQAKDMKNVLNKDHKTEDVVPSVEDVNERMVREISARLAKRVVNTDESIQVLLARGKLEQASKLGMSGNWARMVDELNSMPPLVGKDKDAYRQYDIGVAYEAMGYSAPDPSQAIKMFELAAVNYGTAIDDAPDEKYFREPQTRIETALVTMKTINDRAKNGGQPTGAELAETKAVDLEAPTTKDAPLKQADVKNPVQGDANTLTNSAIINLASHGMDDENLIAAIEDAKSINFDLSPSGLSELMNAKVSNKVLAAMRRKARTLPDKHSARQGATGAKTAAKEHS